MQDFQKILILENEALQKARAVPLIALKKTACCLGSASIAKQFKGHG
jgi:hypothetical protein